MSESNKYAATPLYPFTALVGQENMKLALIANLVNPRIGGVLIRGEKGTAKSTAVRALARLLPMQEAVTDCDYGCDPKNTKTMCQSCLEKIYNNQTLSSELRQVRVVELPVGATEDRLLGSLDMESALSQGKARFQPGILANANRQLLYVDEVNLLDDHLVDALLDAAAMGINTVERESMSVSHPANFTLVGTMNPEEGELRPQLTDRFGLCVAVTGLSQPQQRRQVILSRLEYEKDPAAFAAKFTESEKELTKSIAKARALLPNVAYDEKILDRIVAVSLGLEVDGHRGDLTMLKTAMTLAALEGRNQVTIQDVDQAALLALPHRLRRRPLAEMDFDIKDRLQRI